MKPESSLRKVYVETLSKLAKKRKDFVVFDVDSKEATNLFSFSKVYPDRCFSFGIAEQNMVSAAAGIATTGIIPIVHNYSMFIATRALDQVRNAIAYPKLNVKFVATHIGLDVGKDGVTHQTIEDLAIMRAIPNMVVITPCDDIETVEATKKMLSHKGPVYMRLTKTKVPRFHPPSYKYDIGKFSVIKEGNDVAIFALGIMLGKALSASNALEKEGINAAVINCSTIKPADEKLVIEYALRTGACVTVEDHNMYGGLSGVICEIVARNKPTPVESIGVRDFFAQAGTSEELFKYANMAEEDIKRAAKKAMERKNAEFIHASSSSKNRI